MKKSIAAHLCTVSDFAIDMFDVLDAINYQSYNDFVLRVGEWDPPRVRRNLRHRRRRSLPVSWEEMRHTKRPGWPPGSASEPGLKFWAPLCRVSCSGSACLMAAWPGVHSSILSASGGGPYVCALAGSGQKQR